MTEIGVKELGTATVEIKSQRVVAGINLTKSIGQNFAMEVQLLFVDRATDTNRARILTLKSFKIPFTDTEKVAGLLDDLVSFVEAKADEAGL